MHPARNAIYAEVGGNGWPLSLNYERHIAGNFHVRVGAGLYLADSGVYPTDQHFLVPIIPVMLQYTIGGPHHWEFGAGVMIQCVTAGCEYYSPPESCTAVKATFLVGYRYEDEEGGLMYRAGLTPIVYESGLYYGAGMSVGWGF